MRGQALLHLHLTVFSGPSTKGDAKSAHVFFTEINRRLRVATAKRIIMRFTKSHLATIVASSLILSSCASIFTSSDKKVTFKGVPGTTVIDVDKNTQVAEIGKNGFAEAKIRKGLKSKTLKAEKEGYEPRTASLDTKIQGWWWGNLVLGGVVGMGIDAATGKMMTYKQDFFDFTLNSLPSAKEEYTEIQPEYAPQRVGLTPAGQTDMEKAIVRWYIDSEPRGARIFYRVISSVPNEVKNTNELYLNTTPLEETRSFNINGLTYENSRDVTIEIKISKRGYEDQVKRFNVRQALDQQEISSFFELVKK